MTNDQPPQQPIQQPTQLKIFDQIDKNNFVSVYDEWVKESQSYFENFTREDFYSDKVNHIYFYKSVSCESVEQLSDDIQECLEDDCTEDDEMGESIECQVKPICIHLHSPGGSVMATTGFETILKNIDVPLCVVIEGLCASAATTLALLAPYRVIIEYSEYLIHDMHGSGTAHKCHETIRSDEWSYFQLLHNYHSLIRKRTSLTKEDLIRFKERDIMLTPELCLEKNIIDRILKIPSIKPISKFSTNKYANLNLHTLLRKKHINHLTVDTTDGCAIIQLCKEIDSLYLQSSRSIKPILIHFKGNEDESYFMGPVDSTFLSFRLAMLQKKTMTIALIEGHQNFADIGIVMMCPLRMMMTPSIITSDFSYHGSGYGVKVIDLMENTQTYLQRTEKFLKRFTKLPDQFYIDYKERLITFKPSDMIEYELIHNCQHITEIDDKNLSHEMTTYFSGNDMTTTNFYKSFGHEKNLFAKNKSMFGKNKKRFGFSSYINCEDDDFDDEFEEDNMSDLSKLLKEKFRKNKNRNKNKYRRNKGGRRTKK
jgi:ATP-dependent protease ClpP protease subunit